MFIKNRYSIKDMVLWTRWETLIFLVLAIIPTYLYTILGIRWLHLPWLPIALIGTAVAFIIGFQNNVAYDRIWEARKIWGGIVNASRSFAMMSIDFITNEHAGIKNTEDQLHDIRRLVIYRHIAWLTSLRYSMRQKRPWEAFLSHKTNREWANKIQIPELMNNLDDELMPLLSVPDYEYVKQKGNKSTALLKLQSNYLRELKEKGIIWEFSFLNLEGLLKELFDLQGKSERIKNFPYPRQYATLNNYFTWIFLILLPFGVIPEFARIGTLFMESFPVIGNWFAWGAIPFIVIVSWVFHTMQRIGTVGENPFEGSANDVPISSISRKIEIDLREMLDEDPENIPKPFPIIYNVEM
jgi:putative membrane protein